MDGDPASVADALTRTFCGSLLVTVAGNGTEFSVYWRNSPCASVSWAKMTGPLGGSVPAFKDAVMGETDAPPSVVTVTSTCRPAGGAVISTFAFGFAAVRTADGW